MKDLAFVRGGALRKVYVKDKVITIMTGEMGFTPFVIDLDRLDKVKGKLDKIKADEEFLKELAQLKTEEEIVRDVVKDFQKGGWREIKRKNGFNR